MTSLIAWIGVDARGAGSAYLASDSRISWPGSGQWDYGRKLFACRRYPHIFGYCGDVLFPTQTLTQITDLIDSDLLILPDDSIEVCTSRIVSLLASALKDYPADAKQGFEVLYCMREGEAVPSRFHLMKITFKPPIAPCVCAIAMPAQSEAIAILGSGTNSIQSLLSKWKSSDVGGTSRSVFSAFCDSLLAAADPCSGGPPQLIGLRRKAPPQMFGIIWQKRRYFYGTEVNLSVKSSKVEWRNELFEICDPTTLSRKVNAQPQPRPPGL